MKKNSNFSDEIKEKGIHERADEVFSLKESSQHLFFEQAARLQWAIKKLLEQQRPLSFFCHDAACFDTLCRLLYRFGFGPPDEITTIVTPNSLRSNTQCTYWQIKCF